LKAIIRQLGQGPCQYLVDRRRKVGPVRGQRRRRSRKLGKQPSEMLAPANRRLASQHLEGCAAQRVEIGPAVDRARFDLLGRHVVERADELAGLRQAGRRQRLLAEPEVGQVDVVRTAAARYRPEQHVGRLDVAVYQASGVGRVQRGRDLADDAGCPRRIQRAEPANQLPDVPAPDVAHRYEQHSASIPGLEDGDDVRVVDGRRRPGLADEPLPERLVAGDLRRQDLQCDPPAKPDIVRAVDDRHAAPADLLGQPVAGDLRA